MPRYITLPRLVVAEDEWFPEDRRSCDVIVAEDSPHDTGLVDADGRPLFRVQERIPPGFRGRA